MHKNTSGQMMTERTVYGPSGLENSYLVVSQDLARTNLGSDWEGANGVPSNLDKLTFRRAVGSALAGFICSGVSCIQIDLKQLPEVERTTICQGFWNVDDASKWKHTWHLSNDNIMWHYVIRKKDRSANTPKM